MLFTWVATFSTSEDFPHLRGEMSVVLMRFSKLDFSFAAQVFLDPDRKIFIDEKHTQQEERYFCIGKVKGRILTVRFLYRNDKIRIIGAGYWRKGKKYYD